MAFESKAEARKYGRCGFEHRTGQFCGCYGISMFTGGFADISDYCHHHVFQGDGLETAKEYERAVQASKK